MANISMRLTWLLVAAVALGGCISAGGAPPGRTGDGGTRAAPKTISIGIMQEPNGIGPFHSHTSGGGAHQVEEIAQRYLMTLDSQTRPRPDVAAELPSLGQGTWTISPDGTMETIFKLRPGVRWHDGSAMVADDWVFGWEVDHDPEMPNATSVPVRYITSAVAPDDHTLVLRWSQTYPFANGLTRRQLNPLQRPKHEGVYRSDRDRFINSTAWNLEFIGLGPYRMAQWTQGAQIRFEAFDGFYLGRPKIDLIVVRILHDPNTLLANILADAIDVYLPLGLEEEAVADLQRGWAAPGTGNQILAYPDGRLRYLEVQQRLEQQRPKTLGDRRTREAFYRAIDRVQLADVMIPIAGKEADSWLLPDDPTRETTFRGVIPSYRADRQAALRLLEEVGYRRGLDGSLIDAGTGERFETAVWNTRGGGNERENAIVADHLRSLGMVVDQYIIPASLMDDSEHRASFPGANMTARTVTADFENALFRYRGPTRTSPLGSPRNGYNNPRVIDLVDRLQITVPEEERLQLQRTIMEAVLQELPILPMYWNIETMTIRKGVTGPGPRTGRYNQYPLSTWNVYEWDVAR